jgi:hypothetical protein
MEVLVGIGLMKRAASMLAVAILVLPIAGCGKDSSIPDNEPLRLALEDFSQFLSNLPDLGKEPPGSLNAFNPLEPMAPVAGQYLQSGELVYLWGNGLVDGGERVVAYEKEVEASGGWVLLENGEVVQMSADDFKAAPKASE